MVTYGTYDIKIRVESGDMNVFIDGCLAPALTKGRVGVVEAENQEIHAVHSLPVSELWNITGDCEPTDGCGPTGGYLDGELSNIRYSAIGDSCSSSLDSSTDLHDSSEHLNFSVRGSAADPPQSIQFLEH